MIDLVHEKPITLSNVTKLPMVQRDGRRPHIATIFRWAASGIAGVKLETVQIGGSKCTSLQAVQRFIAQLTHPEAPVNPVTPDRRRAQVASAKRELEAAGI